MCPAYFRPSPPAHAVIIVNSLLLLLSAIFSSIICTVRIIFLYRPQDRNQSTADLVPENTKATTSWLSDRRLPCPQTVVPAWSVIHFDSVIGHCAEYRAPPSTPGFLAYARQTSNFVNRNTYSLPSCPCLLALEQCPFVSLRSLFQRAAAYFHLFFLFHRLTFFY